MQHQNLLQPNHIALINPEAAQFRPVPRRRPVDVNDPQVRRIQAAIGTLQRYAGTDNRLGKAQNGLLLPAVQDGGAAAATTMDVRQKFDLQQALHPRMVVRNGDRCGQRYLEAEKEIKK